MSAPDPADAPHALRAMLDAANRASCYMSHPDGCPAKIHPARGCNCGLEDARGALWKARILADTVLRGRP